MDNKKRLEEGAIVVGLFIWAVCLIIVAAGIFNAGEAFRVVAVLLLIGINVYWFLKVIKFIKNNYRSLYDDDKKV